MPQLSESKIEEHAARAGVADARACRAALNGGSKSFYAASLLLPKSFAQDATALYAFCRLADDLIDDAVEPANADLPVVDASRTAMTSQEALESLYRRLDKLYDGRPVSHAADRSMLGVIERHQLPKSLLLSLFEGFNWDASSRRYETLDDVYAYSARVAGTVGVMMAILMDVREPNMLARAADLGVAMQLTNIARDVGEDARAGRLYLPREWLAEEGIDPDEFLSNPVMSPGLCRVIARLLDQADILYSRADSGIACLPGKVRPAMYAARLFYSEIGAELRKLNYNSVDNRAFVSSSGKAKSLWRLGKLVFLKSRHLSSPALEQTRYLIDCITQGQPASDSDELSLNPLSSTSDKAKWVLELFDELDKRAVNERTV